MVALTYDIAKVSRLIDYHENKVSKGIAECILAGNMPLSAGELTCRQKASYLVGRCTLNANIKLPCLHAVLGFHPLDAKLSSSQFGSISERYMELIGFGEQPFLVYRHSDTYHPHLHIVSTNIRSDGSQIYTHRLGQRLSFPAANRLESEFGLVAAQEPHLSRKERPMPIKALTQTCQPLKKSLRDILLYLQATYSVTDITEWNALLRPFNILALGPKTNAGHPKRGLVYYLTDGCKGTISKGIPEGKLSPDLCFAVRQGQVDGPREATARSRIRAILQLVPANSTNRAIDYADRLLNQGIELIEMPSRDIGCTETVVLDHQLRCAVHEKRLDLDFELKNLHLGHASRKKSSTDLQIFPHLAPKF
ncbi:relaxase/mobilization nuclease domain-containing protein [Sphingobacterium sp.]|uniref:relaxase/mobilization nuclease domain-containing protein n=1 Tax=Sphingobacterium sp. TaxID=341027 RepID=UPI0028AE9513|nr:relaxase/mobilization nuclease domain-containing protein [Sphingobacterium sp.]